MHTVRNIAVSLGIGVAVVGLGAGVAWSHDINGSSASASCVDTRPTVAWSFTSSNAGSFTIQSYTFNRPVLSAGL